jgi:glycosyltransferase involved in cell wall biosynthesis
MLPVKMLEYAAMEIPTIAPRLRVIQHYFDDDSALLYEPDDADDLARCIIAAYLDRGVLDHLRTGLSRFNAKYNWPSMERDYLHMVDELAGRGSVRR